MAKTATKMLRMEPGEKEAIEDAAWREKTNASDWIMRQVRKGLAADLKKSGA